MKRAFTYMFDSQKNVAALVLFFILMLLMVLFLSAGHYFRCYKIISHIAIIPSIIMVVLTTGYGAEILRSFQSENGIIPTFDFRQSVKTGIRFVLAFSLLWASIVLIFRALGNIGRFLTIKGLAPLSFCTTVISLFVAFIVLSGCIVAINDFAKTRNLLSLVKIKSHFQYLDTLRVGHYSLYSLFIFLTVYVIMFLSKILLSKVYILGIIGLLVYTIIVSVVWTYAVAVYMYISVHALNLKKV